MTVSKPETVEVTQDEESLRGQVLDIIHDTLEAEYVGTYIAGMDEAAGKIAALVFPRLNATTSRQDGLREAREALQMAADWFRDYERQHHAKATEDGDRKAETNGERANFLENTLAALSDTPSPDQP